MAQAILLALSNPARNHAVCASYPLDNVPLEGRHLVLTGAMGSGKTTVGGMCARRLGRRLIDSDEQIKERLGMDGRVLVEREGVQRLHLEEARALREAVSTVPPAVIAAAASIGDDPELVSLLATTGAFVVLLDADHEVLNERTKSGGHRRHLPTEEAIVRSSERRRRLGGVVALAVDVTKTSPEGVADLIVASAVGD
ncbi:hypothetical protein BH23ACT5_BH23ACT5_13100 [soil metagenome]